MSRRSFKEIRDALLPQLEQDILAYLAKHCDNKRIDSFEMARNLYNEQSAYRKAYHSRMAPEVGAHNDVCGRYLAAPFLFETTVRHLMHQLREKGLMADNDPQPFTDRTYVSITQQGREVLQKGPGR